MAKRQKYSEDTKLIVVTLLLLLAYPIGVLFMWFWTSWPKWAKWILTIPMIFVVLTFLAVFFLISVDPKAQLKKARESSAPQPTNTVITTAPTQY